MNISLILTDVYDEYNITGVVVLHFSTLKLHIFNIWDDQNKFYTWESVRTQNKVLNRWK